MKIKRRAIFWIFVLCFFITQPIYSKSFKTKVLDGYNIKKLQLIIDTPQFCIDAQTIEKKVQDVFSKTKIKLVKKSSPYALHINLNVLEEANSRFCVCSLNFEITSFVKLGNKRVVDVRYWSDSWVFIAPNPYQNEILSKVTNLSIEAINYILAHN